MSIMSGLTYHQQKSESTHQLVRAVLWKIVIPPAPYIPSLPTLGSLRSADDWCEF